MNDKAKKTEGASSERLVDVEKVVREVWDREERKFSGEFVQKYKNGRITHLREVLVYESGPGMETEDLFKILRNLVKWGFWGKVHISYDTSGITKLVVERSLGIKKFLDEAEA